MRNMSFALTINQINDRSKTVTRRLGWSFLKVGDRLQAVEKAQGIKAGGLKKLAVIEIVQISLEPLDTITTWDVAAEGYPGMGRADFVEMFCTHMECKPDIQVSRIRFRYVEEDEL